MFVSLNIALSSRTFRDDGNVLRLCFPRGFPGGSVVKNPLASAGGAGSIPGREAPLEEGMAAQASILAWEIPWTEKPGGLQSTGSKRVQHDLATELQQNHQPHVAQSALKCG